MKKLDNWLHGNAAPQPPPTTITVREQVRLQGNTTSQQRTPRIPGDEKVRNQASQVQQEGELKTNTMKERELLQRKVVPQASEQSVKKMTKVQEMLLKFDSNPKTVINVKT